MRELCIFTIAGITSEGKFNNSMRSVKPWSYRDASMLGYFRPTRPVIYPQPLRLEELELGGYGEGRAAHW